MCKNTDMLRIAEEIKNRSDETRYMNGKVCSIQKKKIMHDAIEKKMKLIKNGMPRNGFRKVIGIYGNDKE